MSPCHFTSSFNKAYVFYVFATGYLNEGNEVSFSYGVRPVINLKSTTTFIEGTGTSTDPYIVKTP